MPDEGKGLSLHGSSDPEQDAGVGRLVSRHGTSGHTDGDVNFGANLRCGPPARHTRMTSRQPANLAEPSTVPGDPHLLDYLDDRADPIFWG